MADAQLLSLQQGSKCKWQLQYGLFNIIGHDLCLQPVNWAAHKLGKLVRSAVT